LAFFDAQSNANTSVTVDGTGQAECWVEGLTLSAADGDRLIRVVDANNLGYVIAATNVTVIDVQIQALETFYGGCGGPDPNWVGSFLVVLLPDAGTAGNLAVRMGAMLITNIVDASGPWPIGPLLGNGTITADWNVQGAVATGSQPSARAATSSSRSSDCRAIGSGLHISR